MADYLIDLPNVQLGFVKKVYAIILLQLTFMTLSFTICITYPALSEYHTRYMPYPSVLMLVTLMAIKYSPKYSRKVPINYVILAAFTIGQSILVARLYNERTASSILLNLVVALILTAGLTAYTWITPWTYSKNKGICILLVMTLIMYALVFKMLKCHGPVVEVLFLPGSFSMHMVVDTQKIIDAKIQGDTLSYEVYNIGRCCFTVTSLIFS